MNFTASPHTLLLLFYVIKPKKYNTKLASVSLLCKTAAFKRQISKLYPQILSIEASFNIDDRLLTKINVMASFFALNLRTKF